MKLLAYPCMKPSGVDWLGDVPEHWEVKKLGYAAYLQGGYAFASEKFDSEGVPVVRMNNLKRGVLDTSEASCVALENCLGDFALVEGDLLWGMSGSIGETGSLGNFARVRACDLPAQLNQRVGRFRTVGDSIALGFLTYVIQTKLFYDQILLRVTGTAQFNVSSEQVQSAKMPFPHVSEQVAIAAFLDRETGRVDRLVAKKRELIERLKEKRTALISRTVTRGLPPAAARAASLPGNPLMKNSGIEWVGEIPGHWSAKKLGYGAWLQGGYAFASDKFDSEGVPVVRMNNLKRGVLDTTQASCVAPENCVETVALAEGDLLWGMSGSIGETGSLGNFARVRQSDLPAQLNQRVGRFRVIGEQVSLDYLTFVIQTKFFYDQILLFVTGTAQFNVSSAQVQSVFLPFPPLPEQAAIAAYLDSETAKLDALMGKVAEAVERLQEYRTALITAAVTGKIDVRKEISP